MGPRVQAATIQKAAKARVSTAVVPHSGRLVQAATEAQATVAAFWTVSTQETAQPRQIRAQPKTSLPESSTTLSAILKRLSVHLDQEPVATRPEPPGIESGTGVQLSTPAAETPSFGARGVLIAGSAVAQLEAISAESGFQSHLIGL